VKTITLPQYPGSMRRGQYGAAAVEFGIIAILFFILLLGVVEMGRVLFTWNSAAEATRYGARVAAVCNLNDPAILARMKRIMPRLAAGNVVVSYTKTDGSSCTSDPSTCKLVTVKITGLQVTTYIPVVSTTLTVPPFATTIPTESLDSPFALNQPTNKNRQAYI